MTTETKDWGQISDALAAIRQELARLKERVAALEAAGTKSTPAPVAAPATSEVLNEELLVVISAAIAAFLGKKPHIRQIRLLGSAAWAQQGRATIQASHAAQHGRSPL